MAAEGIEPHNVVPALLVPALSAVATSLAAQPLMPVTSGVIAAWSEPRRGCWGEMLRRAELIPAQTPRRHDSERAPWLRSGRLPVEQHCVLLELREDQCGQLRNAFYEAKPCAIEDRDQVKVGSVRGNRHRVGDRAEEEFI